MAAFGDFEPLCKIVPSYPWCNLFYSQLTRNNPDLLTGLSASAPSAPVGVNPECGITRLGFVTPPGITNGGVTNAAGEGFTSIGNVANIAVCGASFFFVVALVVLCNRRKAAVGRVELRSFLLSYLLTLPLQILTTGSIFEQGSMVLTVLTAIHAGAVAATFWGLLANGIVATQVVEDGTMSSMIPFTILSILFAGVTTYVAIDVGLTLTSVVGGVSNPPEALRNIPLFVLTSIWPAAASLIYLILMSYIVLHVLKETKPMWFYLLSAVLFVLSQLALFLLGRVLCEASQAKVDGSFLATLLETAAVGVLYLAWKGITEESWDDDYYPN